MPSKKKIYRVAFVNEGEVWEVYCKSVVQSGLFGFIEIGDLLFGERSTVVVDPSEEKLKRVFEGVGRTYVPIHAVVRIDEVERRGAVSIHPVVGEKGKVVTLPSPLHTPGKRRS